MGGKKRLILILAVSMTLCKDIKTLTNQEVSTINLKWYDLLKNLSNKKPPQTCKTYFLPSTDYLIYGKGLWVLSTKADIPDSSGIIPAVSQQDYSISGVHQISNHCSGKRLIRSLFCFCGLSGNVISVWENDSQLTNWKVSPLPYVTPCKLLQTSFMWTGFSQAHTARGKNLWIDAHINFQSKFYNYYWIKAK